MVASDELDEQATFGYDGLCWLLAPTRTVALSDTKRNLPAVERTPSPRGRQICAIKLDDKCFAVIGPLARIGVAPYTVLV